MNSLFGRSLISITDLSKEEILFLLNRAGNLKKVPDPNALKGKILASCFFEPSTRTRLSFEAAMLRLGGSVIGFSDGERTSQAKGESLSDAIRVIGGYADALVIRHPREGAARLASEAASIPVINGGDGANEHPTQTLLDLFSIYESQGRLEGLNVAFLGDLKYGRTVHSLALIAGFFNLRLYFVSPEELMFPDHLCHELRRAGVCYSFHRSIEEVVDKTDVIYATRIQKERFSSQESYKLTLAQLKNAKETLKILHPLPRVDELDREIDVTPFAYYFEQAQNGLYVRMALLHALLKENRATHLIEELLCAKSSV